MGKKEGWNTEDKAKKQCHDVYVADKKDQKPLISLHKAFYVRCCFQKSLVQEVFHGLVPLCFTIHLRLDYFIHENVTNFPAFFTDEAFGAAGYSVQCTVISPQRFGKPMNRPIGCCWIGNVLL